MAPAATTASGPVSGVVVNGSEGTVPSGTTVTLRGFRHSADPNTAPEEVVTQTAKTNATSAFTFKDVDFPEGRIFLAESQLRGIAINLSWSSAKPVCRS
jgi:hypothetical protein